MFLTSKGFIKIDLTVLSKRIIYIPKVLNIASFRKMTPQVGMLSSVHHYFVIGVHFLSKDFSKIF